MGLPKNIMKDQAPNENNSYIILDALNTLQMVAVAAGPLTRR